MTNKVYKYANLIYDNIDAKRWALVEEMGELMQAFSHERRGRVDKVRVISELADVQMTLNFVRHSYLSNDEWNIVLEETEKRTCEKLRIKRNNYD